MLFCICKQHESPACSHRPITALASVSFVFPTGLEFREHCVVTGRIFFWSVELILFPLLGTWKL